MSEKPKRSEKIKNDERVLSSQRLGFVKGVLVGAILMLAVFSFLRISSASIPNLIVAEANERVIVPFNQIVPTYSSQTYSGQVQLTISGIGQAAGDDYSDAFYLFTQDGQSLATPLTEMFDLEIDGNRAIYTLGLQDNPPPYNLTHEYRVIYDVGETPRLIAFRISDSIVDDNSGEFVIRIHPIDG